MKKCRLFIMAFGLAVLAGGIVRWVSREPEFEGQPLSLWFKRFYSSGQLSGQLDNDRREEAGFALQSIGSNAVPYLISEALNTRQDSPVKRIAHDLANLFRRSKTPFISAGTIHGEAAYALREIKPPANTILPLLTNVLRAANTNLWYPALFLLGTIGEGSEEGLPYLVEALRGKDERARNLAAQSLQWLGPHANAALPELIHALDDPSCPIYYVVPTLGQFGSEAKAALPILNEKLANLTARERLRVAVAICQIDPDSSQATKLIAQALKTKDNSGLRGSAISALRKSKSVGQAFLPLLQEAANDKEDHVATLALDALQDISPELAKSALLKRLNDPKTLTRIWAAGWILRIDRDHSQALATLTNELQNYKARLNRGELCYALQNLAEASPKAKSAISVLRRVFQEDPDQQVREAAQRSLRKINRRTSSTNAWRNGP